MDLSIDQPHRTEREIVTLDDARAALSLVDDAPNAAAIAI
jgi:hypothetical protein